jgi:hypothetical protein
VAAPVVGGCSPSPAVGPQPSHRSGALGGAAPSPRSDIRGLLRPLAGMPSVATIWSVGSSAHQMGARRRNDDAFRRSSGDRRPSRRLVRPPRRRPLVGEALPPSRLPAAARNAAQAGRTRAAPPTGAAASSSSRPILQPLALRHDAGDSAVKKLVRALRAARIAQWGRAQARPYWFPREGGRQPPRPPTFQVRKAYSRRARRL